MLSTSEISREPACQQKTGWGMLRAKKLQSNRRHPRPASLIRWERNRNGCPTLLRVISSSNCWESWNLQHLATVTATFVPRLSRLSLCSFKQCMFIVLGEFLQQPIDFARVGSDLVCCACLIQKPWKPCVTRPVVTCRGWPGSRDVWNLWVYELNYSEIFWIYNIIQRLIQRHSASGCCWVAASAALRKRNLALKSIALAGQCHRGPIKQKKGKTK